MHQVMEKKFSKSQARSPEFPAWTSERVFTSGDKLFGALLEAINEAKKSITLETYIFDQDRLGLDILRALKDAAARGVCVRLLLDGFGCSQWSWNELHALSLDGIQARVYHPLPWQNRSVPWARLLRFRRLLLGLWKLNRRNHRKCCIIDDTIAFVGGMNVSSRQVESHAGASALRDTSVRVEGPAVHRLSSAFEQSWKHPRNLRQEKSKGGKPQDAAVRLNGSMGERRASYLDFLKRVLKARGRVWIANPYFVPDLSLVIALRFAAWNGADVRLLFPRDNNVWGLKWAAKAFYLPLLSASVAIYEYRPSLLHSKVALIDEWALVGSSNLNQRSLLHDLEVDVVLGKVESLRALETGYEQDLLHSDRIRFHRWKRRTFAHRILQRVALVFRRWI